MCSTRSGDPITTNQPHPHPLSCEQRKRSRRNKKSYTARTWEDFEELSNEERAMKRLRKGKITQVCVCV